MNKSGYILFVVLMLSFCAFATAPVNASPFDSETTVIESTASSGSQSASAAVEISEDDADESESSGPLGFIKWVVKKVKSGAKKVAETAKDVASAVGSKIAELKSVDDAPDFVVEAIKIPGHETKEMVFQGICHLPTEAGEAAAPSDSSYRYSLLSYYPKNSSQPSQLVVIDSNTSSAVCRFALYEKSGKAYTGHAGGVTTAGKYIWISSGNKLWGFDLQTVIDFVSDKNASVPTSGLSGLPASLKKLPAMDLIMKKSVNVDSNASFVSFDGKYIWVGDFVKSSNSSYAAIPHHGGTWISGYKVDSNGLPSSGTSYKFKTAAGKEKTGLKPDRIITCRESVQGFAVCGDYVALSISYGAANSKIAFYKNPFSSDADTKSYKVVSGTYKTDCWKVNADIHLKTVTIAAGAEDLEYDGNLLRVGFEGGSPNYKNKWSLVPGVDIETRFYLIDPSRISGLD